MYHIISIVTSQGQGWGRHTFSPLVDEESANATSMITSVSTLWMVLMLPPGSVISLSECMGLGRTLKSRHRSNSRATNLQKLEQRLRLGTSRLKPPQSYSSNHPIHSLHVSPNRRDQGAHWELTREYLGDLTKIPSARHAADLTITSTSSTNRITSSYGLSGSSPTSKSASMGLASTAHARTRKAG